MAKNNFDDLKNTLMSAFNMVTEKVLDLADAAADTAKSGHQIAKLTMEKKKEEAALKDAYLQIGKLYYDLHKEDAEGVFADLCGEVQVALTNIDDIEEEIAVLKDSLGADFVDIEVEFGELNEDDIETVVADAGTEAAPVEDDSIEDAPVEESDPDTDTE